MITVTEAKLIIREASTSLPPTLLPLHEAAGHLLAENIFAGQHHPHFDQAAMDGYAFRFDDLQVSTSLPVRGESAAGTTRLLQAGGREAVRIFTGAPVPAGTDTVVMQEKVFREGDTIIIRDETLQRGGNVRPAGSGIRTGELALPIGCRLTPAAIGLIASLGKTIVCIVPTPRVAIVVTGTELQLPGHPLPYGQVYESNSFTLRAALQQHRIYEAEVTRVADDPKEVQRVLENKIARFDLVLITGGVSAGDYDFVPDALAQCGVEQLFHKVKQKPGKPLYFGKKGKNLVFGLPGNPSSVLTCFYEYVTGALQVQMGLPYSGLPVRYLPLATDYTKKAGLTQFLKGRCTGEEATPLNAQESYRLRSFALADCLIVLEEGKTHFRKGDIVEVHPIIT